MAEKSPHVVKFAGGTERQVTLHTYIFDVLKAVYKKGVAGLDNLCRIMAGDAKTKSLNVRLRHRKLKPPSAKAAVLARPNLTVAELAAEGVRIPQDVAKSCPASASSSASASTGDAMLLSALAPKDVFAKMHGPPLKKPLVKFSALAKTIFKQNQDELLSAHGAC